MKADSNVTNNTKSAKERLGQLMHMRGKEQSPVNMVPTGDICAVAKLKETTTSSFGSWIFRFLDAYAEGRNWRSEIPTERSPQSEF